MIIAHHVTYTFVGCKSLTISKEAFELCVASCGATVLGSIEHQFTEGGCGKTILTMISESHASWHSYPEADLGFADLFTCGDMSEKEFYKSMCEELQPTKVICKYIDRSL